MLNNMRVLELGKFYPPVRGGMETALHEVSQSLRRSGHRVVVLVSHDRRRQLVERRDGVVVWRLALWGMLRGVPVCPGLVAALRRCRREFDPHLVHLHLPNPGAALAWWLMRDRRPLVVTYHSDIVRQRWLGRLWNPLRQRVLARASRIFVTSEAMRDESPALAKHRDRCVVQPLGVDLEWMRAAPAAEVGRWHAELGERFLLFVGRLVYYKGIGVLIEALRDTEMAAVVVGDGPMREAWQEQAVAAGLGSRMRFLGTVSDEDLRALYHACHAFVLPSNAASEAFGVVQLEAMACAKPVVASRASGGVASVHLEGETGLLVPPGDAQALRAALLEVWEDPALAYRLGSAARDRVTAFYQRRHLARRLVAVMEDVGALRAD